MARKYYTLLSKGLEVHHNGEWGIEFGDYVRSVVSDEMSDMKDRARVEQERISFKIITTDEGQAAINAKVAELNQ